MRRSRKAGRIPAALLLKFPRTQKGCKARRNLPGYDEFRQDNPDAPEISLYKDVRLTSVDVLKEGDCH